MSTGHFGRRARSPSRVVCVGGRTRTPTRAGVIPGFVSRTTSLGRKWNLGPVSTSAIDCASFTAPLRLSKVPIAHRPSLATAAYAQPGRWAGVRRIRAASREDAGDAWAAASAGESDASFHCVHLHGLAESSRKTRESSEGLPANHYSGLPLATQDRKSTRLNSS